MGGRAYLCRIHKFTGIGCSHDIIKKLFDNDNKIYQPTKDSQKLILYHKDSNEGIKINAIKNKAYQVEEPFLLSQITKLGITSKKGKSTLEFKVVRSEDGRVPNKKYQIREVKHAKEMRQKSEMDKDVIAFMNEHKTSTIPEIFTKMKQEKENRSQGYSERYLYCFAKVRRHIGGASAKAKRKMAKMLPGKSGWTDFNWYIVLLWDQHTLKLHCLEPFREDRRSIERRLAEVSSKVPFWSHPLVILLMTVFVSVMIFYATKLLTKTEDIEPSARSTLASDDFESASDHEGTLSRVASFLSRPSVQKAKEKSSISRSINSVASEREGLNDMV